MVPRWLERRIKTCVHAPQHTFFASCAPGFESTVMRELQNLNMEKVERFSGGVEFQGKIQQIYAANLSLRSAGRLWLRVRSFRVGAFQELFRKTRSIRWETFAWPETRFHVQIYVRSSRIGHTGGAQQAVIDAIHARWKEVRREHSDYRVAGQKEGNVQYEQMILVHIENNVCRISLDSSGEHLHRRGYRLETAKAPIRENLAAGLILASGWKVGSPFVDPMCGSGTFPIEAAMMARGLPPGRNRDFAFMSWPVYREAQWAHIQKEAYEKVVDKPVGLIVGRDRNAGAIRISNANAVRAEVENNIRFERRDFFSPGAANHFPEGGYIFINVPYGKRIKEPFAPGGSLDRIVRTLRRHYRGWKAMILSPTEAGSGASGLSPFKYMNLNNGGIEVTAQFLKL